MPTGRVEIENWGQVEESNDKNFLSFVEEQINKMKSYSKLGNDGHVSFLELNSALCNFEQIYLTLVGMYNVINIECVREQERFDDWYAEKFLLIRSRENPRDVTAQKWASSKEIEMMVRREYHEEFKTKKESLLTLDRKVAFLRRLLESWQAQQFILNTLQKNIATEVGATASSSS